MHGHEGLELGDERILASEGEVRFDPGLERGQSELLQTRDLGLGKGLEGEVLKCGSAPGARASRSVSEARSASPLARLPPTLLQPGLEPTDVEPSGGTRST